MEERVEEWRPVLGPDEYVVCFVFGGEAVWCRNFT